MIKPGTKAWIVFNPIALSCPEEGNLILATVDNLERKTNIGSLGEKVDTHYEVNFGLQTARVHESAIFRDSEKELAQSRAIDLVNHEISRLRYQRS